MMKILKKYHSLIRYLIFGVLTTIVNLLTFSFFSYIIFKTPNNYEIQLSNVAAWIVGVTFAYFTNKKHVLCDDQKVNKSFFKFTLSRIFTLLVETIGIYIFISKLSFNMFIIKLLLQFIIIVLNFMLSKFWVFNNKKKDYKIKFDFLVLFIIFILCLGCTIKVFQNDTFYSITIGKDILKYGVDMIDHYSIHNIPYTYPHWLYDLFIYFVYNVSGFAGIYFLNVVLYFIIGFLLYFLTIDLYRNRFTSAVFSISAVMAISFFITARAQVITYILFIFEIYLINKFLNSSNKKYLIFFPIISLLIVNMHCAVWPFFFVLFIPYFVEGFAIWYRNKSLKLGKLKKEPGDYFILKGNLNIFKNKIYIEQNCKIKYLIFVMIICVFTGFITLNGVTPFIYFIKTYQGSTLNWIGEHRPPILWFRANFAFYLICAVFILSFVRQKIRLSEFLLMTGSFVMAFSSYRHISLLIICLTFIFVRVVSDYIKEGCRDLEDQLISFFTKKSIIVLIVFIFSLTSISSYYGTKIYKQNYVDDKTYPVLAVDYIHKNFDINEIRMYNDYNFGSYMLFRGIPVFIDSRADLYTKQFNGLKRDITKDYLNIENRYKKVFEYYKLSYALVYKKSNLYKLLKLDSCCKIIYKDDDFAIFKIKK